MEKNIPWHIIIKSFQKKATKEELTVIDDWLKEDESNHILLPEIFNIYKISSSLPQFFEPDKAKAWKTINKRIDRFEFTLKNILPKFKSAVAAAIIILLSFTSLWVYNSRINKFSQQYTEIIAPLGQKTKVVLPDSSLVWLNSGSSLKYNGIFNLKDREVILEGEAFFDVRKNESKKFRVKTGILFINVYGTAFNVKNYKTGSALEITVSEGNVGVADIKKELKVLIPGQQAVLNMNTNKLTFSQTDPEVVSSWKNNELIFENTPIMELKKYLDRWYGVNINIDNAMIGKHRYTFKLKTESLTEMLEKMKVMTPITYEINGEDVRIRYTY